VENHSVRSRTSAAHPPQIYKPNPTKQIHLQKYENWASLEHSVPYWATMHCEVPFRFTYIPKLIFHSFGFIETLENTHLNM
jgi:hypothetical protein